MPPSIQEQLEHNRQVNATMLSHQETIIKRSNVTALPGDPLTEASLHDPDVDPFGGNVNNRNVAKRIANEKRRIYLNHSNPTHIGDPEKARRDIAVSEQLNPDPDADLEPVEQLRLPSMTPTPGSPAARAQVLKSQAEKAEEDRVAKSEADQKKAEDAAKTPKGVAPLSSVPQTQPNTGVPAAPANAPWAADTTKPAAQK